MKKNIIVHAILVISVAFLLSGCGYLEPKIVSSKDYAIQNKLAFKTDIKKVIIATENAFKKQGWEILYQGIEKPKKSYAFFSNRGGIMATKDFDKIAWDKSLNSKFEPKYFITGKTPTSAFSFGTELFIVLYSADHSTTVTQITASSGQLLEKDKLEGYINIYADLLNSEIN